MPRSDNYDSQVSHHERSLLSALVSGRVPFQDVEFVEPSDFIGDCHGVLFAGMRDIATSGIPLALSTIFAECDSRGVLASLGGREGLRLMHSEGQVSYRAAVHHADQVRLAGQKRRLRSMLLAAAEDCDSQDSIESITRSVEVQLRDLQPVSQDDYYTAGEAADSAFTEIETAWQTETTTGLMSGLRDLDEHIGGFRPGQMIVLAARPSIGKSCVGAEIAQRVAERGDTVLFANLEMSKGEMGQRFLSRLSGVPSNLLRRSSDLNEFDIKQLRQASERMRETPLILWGGSGRSVAQLSSAVRRFHARAPLSLCVVDYLGLLRGDGKDRYQQISDVSQKLKALAMELEIPILVLAQLNRESEKHNRPPCLADLRDSGAIEQDADIVIFIVRDRDSEDCTLQISKFRNGPLGSVQVQFEGAYSRISDRQLGEAWRG
jgi:replicative DNA helicase